MGWTAVRSNKDEIKSRRSARVRSAFPHAKLDGGETEFGLIDNNHTLFTLYSLGTHFGPPKRYLQSTVTSTGQGQGQGQGHIELKQCKSSLLKVLCKHNFIRIHSIKPNSVKSTHSAPNQSQPAVIASKRAGRQAEMTPRPSCMPCPPSQSQPEKTAKRHAGDVG
jgi:hypothetical protein